MSTHSKPYISTSFSYETLEETLDVKPKSSMLLIGVPKETAFQENRIGLTPEAVSVLISNGHEVLIEHNAGKPRITGTRTIVKPVRGSFMTRQKYTNVLLWSSRLP